MKRIAITLTIAAAAISSFGQGHVNFVNNSVTRVSTNNVINYLGGSTGASGIGSTSGSGGAPAGYIYAVLAQPYAGSGPTVNATLANVLSGGWTFTGVTDRKSVV